MYDNSRFGESSRIAIGVKSKTAKPGWKSRVQCEIVEPLGRGILRRLLHVHFRMMRGLTIGVRAVVKSPEGQFLLIRHTYTPGWHFPGGGVEKNESTESALERELRQETGLILEGRPVLHGVFLNSEVSERDHVLVYLCQTMNELPPKSRNLEIADIGFFHLRDLPDGVDRGTLQRLQEIVDGRERTLEW